MSTIWIDGVGCFWLSQKDRVTIGGPGTPSMTPDDTREAADLAILSDLEQRHASIALAVQGHEPPRPMTHDLLLAAIKISSP